MTSLLEFEQAISLEKQIWGVPDFEALSADTFVAASRAGGQALGAFHEDQMVGFLLAFPGLKADKFPYLHSHLTGVLPAYQDRGIGRRLKLYQRGEAMRRSLRLIEWTFDPLQLKNAHFNLEILGAIVRRYRLNEYGVSSAGLDAELPSDRCVAEWWIAGRTVEAVLSGKPRPAPAVEDRISVPVRIASLRRERPAEAREIQQGVGKQFLVSFDRGLAVVGYERSDQEGTYLLGRWDEFPEPPVLAEKRTRVRREPGR